MKNLAKVAIAAAGIYTGAVHANSLVEGWYGGLGGLVSYHPNTTFYTPFDTTIQYVVGGGILGQIGYRCGHFRLEAQGVGNYNQTNKITVGNFLIPKKTNNFQNGLRQSGETIMGAGFINGVFDFNDQQEAGSWNPYAGLGIGFAYVSTEVTLYVNGVKTNNLLNTNTSHIAGQGIFGISYALDNFTTIAIDGRYISTNSQSKNSNQNNNNERYQAGMVSIMFNTAFDGMWS